MSEPLSESPSEFPVQLREPAIEPLPIGPPRRPPDDPFSGLGRWLYTHNPFYAISAALVFWGLRSSFDTQINGFHTFALMGGLVLYTTILALAAVVVIRFGRVWQDGRSLLLLVVLMFLAISISFDDALSIHLRNGTLCYLGALVFSIAVSEGVLRAIRLRLPALFRLPYYLLLALSFVYPVVVRWVWTDRSSGALPWAALAFSPIAGLAFLTLLPAIRRGPAYVRDNGSPWPWPLYPWSLFFILALGMCGKIYYLCVTLHMVGGEATIFGFYFFAPLLLAIGVLLLEMGIVQRSTKVMCWAMLVPPGLIAMSLVEPLWPLGSQFLRLTLLPALHVGPPLITVVAAIAFYLWAWARRAAGADVGLSLALLVLAIVGRKTVDVDTLTWPHGGPILALGLIQAALALRHPSSLRWLVAASGIVLATTLELWNTPFMTCRGAAPIHLMLAAVLAIGAWSRDPLGRWLQNTGAMLLAIATIIALTDDPSRLGHFGPLWLSIYTTAMVATATAYGWFAGNRRYFAAAAGSAACWLGVFGLHGYRQARQAMAGLDYILSGLASLLLAMLISLAKTDVGKRWFAAWQLRR